MANIVGGVTSINNPRTNWAQTDAKKADYLKNKPSVANALKGHKTGAVISADDVSPIEHELEVKIIGENVEGTVVKRYGKNLFANDFSEYGKQEWITSNGSQASYYGYAIRLPIGTHTINARLKDGEEQALYGRYLFYIIKGANNVSIGPAVVVIAKETRTTRTFSINEGDVLLLYNGNTSASSGQARIIFEQNDIQIELGEKATEFEPYNMVEAVADADGNVEGLISHAPDMILITDKNEVVIECEYNRDANKVVTDLETKLNTLIATIGG